MTKSEEIIYDKYLNEVSELVAISLVENSNKSNDHLFIHTLITKSIFEVSIPFRKMLIENPKLGIESSRVNDFIKLMAANVEKGLTNYLIK